jgi:hypothetical protein
MGRKRKPLKGTQVFWRVERIGREVDLILVTEDAVLKTLEVNSHRVRWPFSIPISVACPDSLLPHHVVAFETNSGIVFGGGGSVDEAVRLVAYGILKTDPEKIKSICKSLPKKAVEVDRNKFMIACYKFEGRER